MRSRIGASLMLFLSLSSRALGQHWERRGPEGGMVVSLGAGPEGHVYLGTADGHLFASTDRGVSWELRGRVGSRSDAVVTRLVADPENEGVLFAAVWYRAAGAGGGVFRSEDAGRTWRLAGLDGEEIRALEIAPSKKEELVAGTRSGVFRSVDSGGNWERISPAGDEELRNVDSLAIDPRDPATIYAGTYHLPWRTTDGGKSWKPVIAGVIDDSDIMSLRIDVNIPQRLYMSACSGIYRSENQGEGWTKLQGIPYAARRTQVIAQDTANPKVLYAGTTEGLWLTRDGGENWVRTTPKDWVVNSLVVLRGSGEAASRVILGTEGQGVEISDDAGLTFSESNRGFTHVVVKQLVDDPRARGHLLMLTEQGGLQVRESHDEGGTWAPLTLALEERGSRGELRVEQIQQVCASPWGWLLQLTDGQLWLRNAKKNGWTRWRLRLPASASSPLRNKSVREVKVAKGLQLTGVPMRFAEDFAVISATEGLLRCLPSGLCTRLKAFGKGSAIRAIWVSPDGGDFLVTQNGKLGRSTDGGETASWQDLPIADENVLWLDVVEFATSKSILLGTSRGLYAMEDGGAHWSKLNVGLPEGQMDLWLRTPKFWLATEGDGGTYVTLDQGISWLRVDHDAERGRFTGLVAGKDGSVLLGSQSEGLLLLRVNAP